MKVLGPGLEPDRENTGFATGEHESTTKFTTPAAMFGECVRDHLSDAQLAELVAMLQRNVKV